MATERGQPASSARWRPSCRGRGDRRLRGRRGQACEHVFVTAQGSAYSRLRGAIERRNTLVAWATAAELPHVELGDALALVLLALDSDAPRFERAAVRWHSRMCGEAQLTGWEAQLALIRPHASATLGDRCRECCLGRDPEAPPNPDQSFASPCGCCINPRRARWIASKGGLRKRPSRPSRADRPSRGRRARLL
jgi:hypothetical protein